MTQEQYDKLEKLVLSIKNIDKKMINDKVFNDEICQILEIKGFELNYPESWKKNNYNDRYKSTSPWASEPIGMEVYYSETDKTNGVDEMLFKPECTTSDKFEYTSAIEDNTKDVTTYNINSTITYC